MALRAEKRTQIAGGLIALLLAPAAFSQQQFRYEVWHGHTRPPHPVWHGQLRPGLKTKFGNPGTLTITAQGVVFEETYKKGEKPKRPHDWRWDYQDIQQLKIAPNSLTVLTYKDDGWKLGADREYHFDLSPGRTFEDTYGFLKSRLDQRFVAAIAARPANPLWVITAKRRVRLGRYEDIDNISNSGPFEFTITTFERAKLDYGSRKQFTFRLKQRLDEARYNDLWLRLNQSKGLKILEAYRAAERN